MIVSVVAFSAQSDSDSDSDSEEHQNDNLGSLERDARGRVEWLAPSMRD